MELRQITYFLKVAEYESFSRAAEDLFVTQPALTIAVKKLEEELGVSLLRRSNKSITLTESGRLLQTYGGRVLDAVDELRLRIELEKQQKKALNIAVPSICCSQYYPIIYRFFRDNNPDIHVKIQDLRSPEVVRKVSLEEVDLGLGIIRNVPDDVIVERLGYGRVNVILSSSHPLSRKDTLTLEDLRGETAFVCSGHTFSHDIVVDALTGKDLGLSIDDTFDDHLTIINLVARNMGISLLPETDSATVLNNNRIAIRTLKDDPDITYEIGLFYKKDGLRNEPAQRLISFLKNTAAL